MASSSKIRRFISWTIVGSTRLRSMYRLPRFVERNLTGRNQKTLHTEIEYLLRENLLTP